jgi:anthranilate synthase component 2
MNQKSILLIDNYDSFTFTICDYLKQCGANVRVLDRNRVTLSDIQQSDGVVISPGPGNPVRMPGLLELTRIAIEQKPVLGICLGFQAMAATYGLEIIQGKPMHGKISRVFFQSPNPILENIRNGLDVVRYHSLQVKEVIPPFQVLLQADSGEIMGIAHQFRPAFGLQFHPEAYLSQSGLCFFQNWLKMC